MDRPSRIISMHLPIETIRHIDDFRRELLNKTGNIPSRSEVYRACVTLALRDMNKLREYIEDEE